MKATKWIKDGDTMTRSVRRRSWNNSMITVKQVIEFRYDVWLVKEHFVDNTLGEICLSLKEAKLACNRGLDWYLKTRTELG